MQQQKNDKIDKLIYKFVNMSINQKRNFMQKISDSIDALDIKIKVLEEKQFKLFELYFKQYNKLNGTYKKLLECLSQGYNNKILKLEKQKNKMETDMLYCSLVDKKMHGFDIEITK